MKYSIIPHTLQFKFAAGTSRGVMHQHKVWYVKLEKLGKIGIGEIAPLPGLSCDWSEDFGDKLPELIEKGLENLSSVTAYPSVAMGLHTALLSLENDNVFTVFPGDFIAGKQSILINGLVWMNDKTTMLQQIDEKIKAGFTCIKLKIGAINFEDEIALLKHIRTHFSANDIEIRVDANGAFPITEVLSKLEKLAQLEIHSIEQPIKAGQLDEMAQLCQNSPLPIALDEELIGVFGLKQQKKLLQHIQPQYIIIKPTLLGSFETCNSWIETATTAGIDWWATSALESNVGLNAIAQWVSTFELTLPQGLGTGQLYHNNVSSPLEIDHGYLKYNQKTAWDFEKF